jgi:hypothetical protein
MRRKILLRTGIVLLVLGGLLTALFLMIQHEPEFYRNKEIPPGPLRTEQSRDCEARLITLLNDIADGADTWQATLTEAQINSYLQERFIQSGLAGMMLKGISEPRVSIDDDVIRLGFRYGTPPWSTVVSVDLRVWQAPKETNVVALEIVSLRAGMIPLSSKFLMDQLTTIVRTGNRDIEVDWYRHEGNLVALLRFNGPKQRSSNQLETLTVGQGKITIAGRSLNALPVKTESPPAAQDAKATPPNRVGNNAVPKK